MDVERQLHYNTTCIYIMVEEECGDASACLPVDDGPVDGCCSTILWQQGCMHIKGTVFGHIPHHFWKHSECHHHLQVGIEGTELMEKILILHLHGLKHRQVMFYGILLHCRGL